MTPTAPESFRPSAWLRVWLALLPAVYFASPLSLLALPRLRRLPRPVWWVLGFYALSQQLPALLAPDPLLASVLALARTALMLGLIGVGASLGSAGTLRMMGVGLGLVYVIAIGLSLVQGRDLLAVRLVHPYMTSITLGLAGAAGMWLGLFAGGRLAWRLPLGVAGLGVLLLTGSRGPLAAAVIGTVLGLAVRSGRRLAVGLLLGAAALTGAYIAGQQLGIPALERLNSTDTSGRDVIWYSALSVIHSAPLGGVGSYLVGDRLAPPGDPCTLWPTTDGAALCPAWIAHLGHPWVIAHNAALQQLAEAGPLGLLGLFVLLGVVVAAATLQRDSLSLAVLSGLLVATANDNTLLVPGPFIGELFWITAGIALVRVPLASPAVGWAGGLAATGLLVALSAPLVSTALPRPPAPAARLSTLIAPRTVASPEGYVAYVRLDAPPGSYRLALQACQLSCAWVRIIPVTIPAGGLVPVTRLSGNLYQAPQQRVELLLYPGKSSIRPEPLAQTKWTVRWTP